jgi:7,8-dihydropterin-6-yl-methyl-4-(beta-D-ribofuranosyl)aminobenzene 5'-phosphate synthase
VSVKITTLTENSTQRAGILSEHGLSILIETRGCKILLDTGQTNTTLQNARALGIDLREVQAVVLSHGHFDHTGGLRDVVREIGGGRREVEIVCHPDVFAPHYSVRQGEQPRYVGIAFSRQALEGEGAAIRANERPAEIWDCALITGEVPRLTPFEHVDSHLRVPAGDGWAADPVLDDQAMIVRTRDGLVVVLGCAHSGLINTLEYARQITGEERILAVVGGTHLGPAPDQQLDETIRSLKGYGIRKLGVSHCTGPKAAARLAHEFGDTFFFNTAGSIVELV